MLCFTDIFQGRNFTTADSSGGVGCSALVHLVCCHLQWLRTDGFAGVAARLVPHAAAETYKSKICCTPVLQWIGMSGRCHVGVCVTAQWTGNLSPTAES